MRMRVTKRWGSCPDISVQVGDAAVPFSVLYVWPKLWPTQITSALPGATAMALIAPDAGLLILVHVGVGAFASLLRQRLTPPASSRLLLLGSRMKGAMTFA